MKMMEITILIIAGGTIPQKFLIVMEDIEKKEQGETIKITALSKLGRTLRIYLDTWRDLQPFKLQWKTIN